MTKIQWHPAFCAAMQLEFKDSPTLEYISGLKLNEKPLELDLLIINKPFGTKINNKIGEVFKGHNIVEYKSPADHGFNGFAIAQALSYASYYCDKNKTWDVTLTLIVSNAHFNILHWMKNEGIAYTERHKGIYDLHLQKLIRTQIVITEEIDSRDFAWLSSLTDRLSKEQAKDIVMTTHGITDINSRLLVEAVMHVVTDANEELFNQLKKENKSMESALMRIMKPEVDEIVHGKVKEIAGRMIQLGSDNDYIKYATNMTDSEINLLRNDSK